MPNCRTWKLELRHDDYFAQVAEGLDRPERLEMARRQGLKTVALVGVDIPETLFWACGAVPISLGRFVANVGVGAQDTTPSTDRDLPRDICAIVRTTFDLLAHRWIPAGLVDAVVVAGGCDWITRLGNGLEGMVPVWPLNISRAADFPHSRLGSLEKMLTALERLTDLPLARRAFKTACERAIALDALCGSLDHLRLGSPPTIGASDYYRIVGALALADPLRWADAAQALVSHQRSAASNQQSEIGSPRVVLCGCPAGFPDLSLIGLIEQTGFQIVGEDFSAHGNSRKGGKPPRGGRSSIFKWVAETLTTSDGRTGLLPVTNHGLADELVSPLLAQMTERRADGMIRLHYRGCAVNAMEAANGKSGLADRDVAVLALEVEQMPPAIEALRTRLEAFCEQLLSRSHVSDFKFQD